MYTLILLAVGIVSASAQPPADAVFYHTDHIGSVRGTTDAQGRLREWLDYLPYGEEVTATENNRPKFTGQRRDAETGADDFVTRYYSNTLGRFMSSDEFRAGRLDPFTGLPVRKPGPLPYADIPNPSSLNSYAYVLNNPLRYTDPDGHVACAEPLSCTIEGAILGSPGGPLGAAVGGLVGAAIGVGIVYVGQKVYTYFTEDGKVKENTPPPPGDHAKSQEPAKTGTAPPPNAGGQNQQQREKSTDKGAGLSSTLYIV